MIDTLEKLFNDNLKDLFNAEKQFLKLMPKLAKAATSTELKAAIDKHLKETEVHVERLEKAAELLEIKPTGVVCKATNGLVAEAEEHLEEVAPGPILDAAIIECAQKNEHYEICSYGTMISWAQQLNLPEIVALLEKTLGEEKATDGSLSALAKKSVNPTAGSDSPAKKVSVK